jgi:hypothetical protein
VNDTFSDNTEGPREVCSGTYYDNIITRNYEVNGENLHVGENENVGGTKAYIGQEADYGHGGRGK